MDENVTLHEANRKNGIEIENLKDALINLKDKAEWELRRRDELENKL